MLDRKRSAPQIWLTVVAGLSAAALLFGVAITLLTGVSSLWFLLAAIALVASLTSLSSLRRTRTRSADRVAEPNRAS